MKMFHCISGLPRSGSSLLSSILSQNPKFFTSITDPLVGILCSVVDQFEYAGWNQDILTESKKIEILQSIMQTYYSNIDAEVCFNTSRHWTSQMSLLAKFSPNTKVICCVRDIPSIINSFEKLRNDDVLNPTKHLYGKTQSVYRRAENLMSRENIIGESLDNLKQAFYGMHSQNVILVEYDNLITKPKETMSALYSALNLEHFDHDFNDLPPTTSLNDPSMPKNLHLVAQQIIEKKAKCCIPSDLWNRFSGMEFWRNS